MQLGICSKRFALLLMLLLLRFSVPPGWVVAGQAEIYRDKNGFFAVLSPEGWQRQDYPSETTRSKVGFHLPANQAVNIRILAAPVTRNFSLDELKKQSEQGVENVRRQYVGLTYSYGRGRLGVRDVILGTISLPGTSEQKVIVFQDRNVLFNISFGGNSKKDLERHAKTFEHLLDSFVTLDTGKKYSDAEARSSFIAGLIRVAQLREQQGTAKEALELVTRALTLEPNNAQLKAMEQRLRSVAGKQ